MSFLILCDSVPLRPYQGNVATAVLDRFAHYRAVLVVLATGLGKTRIGKSIVRTFHERNKRCLWLVDSDPLVEQAVLALTEEPGGVTVDVDKAGRRAERWSTVVVASVPTLRNTRRLERFEKDAFDLIILDEAHRSLGAGWVKIVEYFNTAKILGLTATPDRSDGESLGKIFENTAAEMDIRVGIEEGWLVPVFQRFVQVDGLDYSNIRREAMRLREGDMNAALVNAEMIEKMGWSTTQEVRGRRTLVFTCSVDHAYAFAKYLCRIGKTAEAIDGKTKPKRAKEILAAYARGDFQFACNCAKLTTGFDDPETSAVAFARPIISRLLYTQCAGRGTRSVIPEKLNDLMHDPPEARRAAIAASSKPDCLLLDFLGNSGKLRLVHAAHAMAPSADDQLVKEASDLAWEEQIPIHIALGLAEQARVRLLEEIDRLPAVEHGYQTVEIDPFVGPTSQQAFDLLGLRSRPGPSDLRATPAQIHTLQNLSVSRPESLSQIQAADLIAELVHRKEQDLASPEDMRILVEIGGFPADKIRHLSKERAARGVAKLRENGWQRPPSWGTSN